MALGSTSLKPSMWLRYVDDTFILWPHLHDVQILLDHVNSIRPSIQFTLEKEQDNKLLFLDVLVTHTEQGFRSSMYRKHTFTGQYHNFNSHHPYTEKKGIVRSWQHRAKTISSDTDAYQEEKIRLRHNLHCNNYPERITSAPRDLHQSREHNTQNLTTICLPYINGVAERIKKICCPYDIRTVFTSGSTLRRYIFRIKPPTEFNMIKNCVFSIPSIIIIMSRRLRGYPWPSLAISPYHSSPPAGLQDYNPCPHIAAVCKFVLVVPLLHIHEWGSTGVHRLWARPCFSSSVLRVWFVELV